MHLKFQKPRFTSPPKLLSPKRLLLPSQLHNPPLVLYRNLNENTLNVPSFSDFRSKFRPIGYDESALVASLIDHTHGEWNEATVRNLFLTSESELNTGHSPWPRNQGVSDFCPVCKAPGEVFAHAILHCPIAQQTWALSDLPWRVVSDWKGDAEAWLCGVLDKLEGPDADFAPTLCWQIWLNRNRWLWDGGGLSPPDIVWRARCLLSEFIEYHTSLKGREGTMSNIVEW
ncbi:hypothetical protein Salat_2520900 [Sesamum alatum]|uniref:Reverse transcriptase zinc-binding domain-containing protein n=1 Tax=Sesamum alatum TaxID=300844 RepID=A0AAE1XST4_9LAMI|nr:hypothetical protein Salat_2520900 [Sesamum alatum]